MEMNQTTLNDSMDFNVSEPELDCLGLLSQINFLRNPFGSKEWLRTLVIALYSIIATAGALGNFLVILVIIKRPSMRTPRNYFVMNLAISDFIMCTITVPFQLVFFFDMFWMWGDILCRTVASMQGVNVFVSTLSITAISLDRYLLVIFPTNPTLHKIVPLTCFLCVWLWSLLMASPMFFSAHLKYPLEKVPPARLCGIAYDFPMCREQFDPPVLKLVYTVCCSAFQYVLPLATLAFVYLRISLRLRARLDLRAPSRHASSLNDPRHQEQLRQNRANKLIICIVTIFAVVWLPLNLYIAIVAFYPPVDKVERFAFCHMVGMLSACANPVLYGVFNENFRREFVVILRLEKLAGIFGGKLDVIPLSQAHQSVIIRKPPQQQALLPEETQEGTLLTTNGNMSTFTQDVAL